MISCSISFLILCTSGAWTVLGYFKHLWKWFRAGDLLVVFNDDSNYLNEIPMAEYLNQFT